MTERLRILIHIAPTWKLGTLGVYVKESIGKAFFRALKGLSLVIAIFVGVSYGTPHQVRSS